MQLHQHIQMLPHVTCKGSWWRFWGAGLHAADLSNTENNRRREHQQEAELTHIRINGKVAAQLSAFTISNSTIICENRKTVESCKIFLSQLSTIAIRFQITASMPKQIPSPDTGKRLLFPLKASPPQGFLKIHCKRWSIAIRLPLFTSHTFLL